MVEKEIEKRVEVNTRYRIPVPHELLKTELYAKTERGTLCIILGEEYKPTLFDWWAYLELK